MKNKQHMNAIAAVLIAVASIVSAQAPAPSAAINPAVLLVNGQEVFASEISMVMSNIASQMRAQGQQPTQEQMVEMATQRVIEQKLLAAEARKQGLVASELRVAEMMQTLEKQMGGRDQLTEMLTARGTTVEKLQQSLEEMDLSRSLIDRKVTPTITVSDEEIADYYNQNTEQFVVEDQVRARHILFAVSGDGESNMVAEAQKKAEAARARAVGGEDFAALATELSEGPSAENGGDIGFFSKQQMDEQFAEAAFALEPGQISEVVRTDFGFHVIKVEEKRAAGTLPLDEVDDSLRSLIGQRKTAQAVGEIVKQLAETATVTPLLTPEAPAPQPTDNVPSLGGDE